MKKITKILLFSIFICVISCSSGGDEQDIFNYAEETPAGSGGSSSHAGEASNSGEVSTEITKYTDGNGDVAYIPAQFRVSDKTDEQTVRTGLVVIGPDGSEYVWVPTIQTPLQMRNFGSYFSGGSSLSGYYDETNLPTYQAMAEGVDNYGGFYISRYEVSRGDNNVPVSKPVTAEQPGSIWVRFSPQDATTACANLYRDNSTVQGFFPWGCTWDTTLQWLVDTGCKTFTEVASNSSSWGNYSDDTFSPNARNNYTGAFEQAKANNIYDLAGNNWEWTQERYGSDNYVMRSGGYNLMDGPCPGSRYPAAIRDPLPGNNHHPNVTVRVALYLTYPLG